MPQKEIQMVKMNKKNSKNVKNVEKKPNIASYINGTNNESKLKKGTSKINDTKLSENDELQGTVASDIKDGIESKENEKIKEIKKENSKMKKKNKRKKKKSKRRKNKKEKSEEVY